jgi:CheY-like chemotaxis protein
MDPYRILIVDDQRDVRRLLREALQTLGLDLQVVDVPSGEEAILVISNQRFDLLVSDVRLPGISGLEVKKKAQIQNPNLKLILITGMTEPEIRQQVVDAGADAFFFKPVEIADFLDSVERCLGVVKTIFPPEPVLPEDDSVPAQSLSEKLSSLRQELNAFSAALLDDRGRVTAGAGDLPGEIEEANVIPILMGALSAAAKVDHLLSATLPQNILIFSGGKVDLYLANVGEAMALLLALEPSHGERQGEILGQVQMAVKDLQGILLQIGVATSLQPGATETPEEPPELVPEVEEDEESPVLDEIFGEASQTPYDPQEVDAFWDSLAHEEDQDQVMNADVITYDQAKRLGLAPDEGE